MPTPSPQQKLKVGIYVAILSMVILVIWMHFLKYELKGGLSQKSENSIFTNINGYLKEFISQSQEAFQKARESLKSLSSPSDEVPSELAQTFIEKAQEELRQKRTADWLLWQNNSISFKYPGSWFVEPESQPASELQLITLTSYNPKEQLSSGSRAEIEISFKNNPDNLTTLAWWQIQGPAAQATSTVSIAGQSSLKISYDTNQLIFIPYNGQMIEILVTLIGENQEEFGRIADDFIQTILFSN